MLPTSLYIHIPWCTQKCPYCDFNSHKQPLNLPEQLYIATLINDLQNDLQLFAPRVINSIFIGGGTPSLFSAESYYSLFQKIAQLLPFAPNIEITLEANPNSIDQLRFKGYRQAGINRISIGIQSFNQAHLQALGRSHNALQAHQAIDVARNAGFNNINLDLMHGLPGQTIEQGLEDLQIAIQYAPEHLSWYQLTIEPNTIFYKKPPNLPHDDLCATLEDLGVELLAAKNFNRYEISAFCKPEHEAQHNLNYWLFGDYYGIGAGAHCKITDAMTNQVTRMHKYRQPQEYLNNKDRDRNNFPFLADQTRCAQTKDLPKAGSYFGNDPYSKFVVSQKNLSAAELIFEFMLNTTRLQQKISAALFTQRTGLKYSALESQLAQAQRLGLLNLYADGWQITAFGRKFTNNLQQLFL